MGTDIYMGITITDGPAGVIDELPNFELTDSEKWDTLSIYDAETKEFVQSETGYHCYGVGRYGDAEAIGEWILAFTTAHPECTIVHTQEWDADGHGEEELTYRKGELVREESKVNAMVPMQLAEMLENARQVLAEYGKRDPLQSQSEHYAALAPYLAGSLDQLVKGLS